MTTFQYDDGGRKAAGFKGAAGDCVVRSIAIATSLHYGYVYDTMRMEISHERRSKNKRGKSSARDGVYRNTIRRYMEAIGWEWVPTMFIGSGCKVHLRSDELPTGRLVVSLSGHITAMVDGVIRDTYDPSRDGTRCVYGYWKE